MIECVDKNVYSKKRKKHKRFLGVFLFVAFIAGIFFYYKNVVSNTIAGICADYLKSYSTKSVNIAVLEEIKANAYSDFVLIEKNGQGDIVLISTDSVKVNEVNKKIALKTEKILSEMFNKGVDIPFLAFSGINFLAGYGTPVKFKTVTITSVVCDFSDTLCSAGINQTLHSLYITVETTASLNMPAQKKVETCKTKVLISEAVIVGKIPEIYLNSNHI